MGPQSQVYHRLKCRSQNDEIVTAKVHVDIVGGPKSCKWRDYLIDCKFKESVTNLQLGSTDLIQVSNLTII